jgi:hypothetical protein
VSHCPATGILDHRRMIAQEDDTLLHGHGNLWTQDSIARTVKILQRTISLTFTASPFLSPQLEFQPAMAHTEAHRSRRGRGENVT